MQVIAFIDNPETLELARKGLEGRLTDAVWMASLSGCELGPNPREPFLLVIHYNQGEQRADVAIRCVQVWRDPGRKGADQDETPYEPWVRKHHELCRGVLVTSGGAAFNMQDVVRIRSECGDKTVEFVTADRLAAGLAENADALNKSDGNDAFELVQLILEPALEAPLQILTALLPRALGRDDGPDLPVLSDHATSRLNDALRAAGGSCPSSICDAVTAMSNQPCLEGRRQTLCALRDAWLPEPAQDGEP